MDYAAGIFNGNRNGFLDFDNGKDVASFVNFLPFLKSDSDFLKHFNVGGSVLRGLGTFRPDSEPAAAERADAGQSDHRRAVPGVRAGDARLGQAGVLVAAHGLVLREFVADRGVAERLRVHGEPAIRRSTRTRIPVQSFYVQLGYFLTGEKVEMRNVVKPDRPFDLRQGKRGPGAWELALRYNALDVSNRVFSAGFADPNLWTNRVDTIDVGLNWYWNQYIKTYIGWQHAIFADPVLVGHES